MALFVEKPGILTTIQDLGRPSWRRLGIPLGGAADRFSASLANLLVGNEPEAALVEFHFPAPVFQVENDCLAALVGAGRAKIGDTFIEDGRPFFLKKGDKISFSPTQPAVGVRGYFGVAGGIDLPDWLGSRSTLLSVKTGGFEGRELRVGDRLDVARSSASSIFQTRNRVSEHGRQPSFGVSRNHFLPPENELTIACLPGPEFGFLSEKSIQLLENQWFKVQADSNRMGFRLLGEPVFLNEKIEMISTAVAPGTVQLLPDGQLIALGPDCQTTGGYPRILQVISAHLPRAGQLRPGKRCRFQLVNAAQAEQLLLLQNRFLRQIKWAVRLAFLS